MRKVVPRPGALSSSNLAAVLLHDAVAGREAQPGALADRLRGEEGLERPRLLRRGHPHARVVHRQHRGAVGARGRRELDHAAAGHGVPGVHGEVHQHLLELPRVPAHPQEPGRGGHPHLHVLADEAGEEVVEAAHDRVEVDHLQLEALAAAEGEHLRGEGAGALGGVGDRLEVLVRRMGLGEAVLHEARADEDRGEEVVEVVGDPAREAADGLEPLGLLEPEAQPLALLNLPAERAAREHEPPVHREQHGREGEEGQERHRGGGDLRPVRAPEGLRRVHEPGPGRDRGDVEARARGRRHVDGPADAGAALDASRAAVEQREGELGGPPALQRAGEQAAADDPVAELELPQAVDRGAAHRRDARGHLLVGVDRPEPIGHEGREEERVARPEAAGEGLDLRHREPLRELHGEPRAGEGGVAPQPRTDGLARLGLVEHHHEPAQVRLQRPRQRERPGDVHVLEHAGDPRRAARVVRAVHAAERDGDGLAAELGPVGEHEVEGGVVGRDDRGPRLRRPVGGEQAEHGALVGRPAEVLRVEVEDRRDVPGPAGAEDLEDAVVLLVGPGEAAVVRVQHEELRRRVGGGRAGRRRGAGVCGDREREQSGGGADGHAGSASFGPTLPEGAPAPARSDVARGGSSAR
ncbi:MAG: hypothetical protein QM704_16275 [Anaeromyxobacteraceae bacterium]